MDNKTKGIVKAVNKNGILLITPEYQEGQWWNGLGAVASSIIQELKGKEIELSIINQEKRSFSYLNITKDNVQTERPKEKGVGVLDRERIIVRQNAGSHASSFIACLVSNGYYQVLDVKQIKADYFEFAAEFEGWVFRC